MNQITLAKTKKILQSIDPHLDIAQFPFNETCYYIVTHLNKAIDCTRSPKLSRDLIKTLTARNSNTRNGYQVLKTKFKFANPLLTRDL